MLPFKFEKYTDIPVYAASDGKSKDCFRVPSLPAQNIRRVHHTFRLHQPFKGSSVDLPTTLLAKIYGAGLPTPFKISSP